MKNDHNSYWAFGGTLLANIANGFQWISQVLSNNIDWWSIINAFLISAAGATAALGIKWIGQKILGK